MSATSSNRGFTLLEILIAVVLLGIVAAALYTSYFTTLRARERVTEGAEARRELTATLDLIRKEVAAAQYGRPDKRLRFIVEDRDRFGRPSSNLEFTTMASDRSLSAPGSGISAVRYRVAEKNQQLFLQRCEQDLFFERQDAPWFPQMERIAAFLVECHDGGKWVRSWDTALNGALPKLLRVTVTIDENGKPRDYTVLAPLRVTGS